MLQAGVRHSAEPVMGVEMALCFAAALQCTSSVDDIWLTHSTSLGYASRAA